MVNDFNGGLRRDSLKSNKNPNYGAAAQVARWLESSSPARAPSGLRSGAPGKTGLCYYHNEEMLPHLGNIFSPGC